MKQQILDFINENIHININPYKLTLREVGEEYIYAFLKAIARNIDRNNSLQNSILKAMTGEKNKKRVLLYKHIYESSLKCGNSFYKLLEKYPKVFSSKLVSYIAAGEKGGNTTKAINTALENIEIEKKIVSSFFKSISLPIVYFSLTFSLWIINYFALFPMIYSILDSLDPSIANLFINKKDNAMLIALSFIIVFSICITLIITGIILSFKKNIDIEKIIYNIPYIGKIVFHTRRYTLLKTIGSLLKNGMELKIVLKSIIPFTNYLVFVEELKRAQELAKRGKNEIWGENLLSEIEKIEMKSTFSSYEMSDVFLAGSERSLLQIELLSKIISRTFSTISILLVASSIVLTIMYTMLFNIQLNSAIRNSL